MFTLAPIGLELSRLGVWEVSYFPELQMQPQHETCVHPSRIL